MLYHWCVYRKNSKEVETMSDKALGANTGASTELTDRIRSLMNEYADQVIEWRRYFHKYPELSMQEFETTKRIAAELDKMGIPYEINPEKNTGLVATIQGGKPGKTVALRSDIDGLPVTEMTGVDFASTVPGCMHACGHDGHMSVLLGAAKILQEVKDDLHGKVYLVFQASEENGEGSKYMRRFGTWYDESDSIFGGHIWIDLPAGKINLEAGDRMAAAWEFHIYVHGKQGHGAQPHLSIDTIVASSAIVMNLQSIVSRRFSPLDSVVLTVGKVTGGDRYNVISGETHMEGTLRYFSKQNGKDLMDLLVHVAKTTAEAYGATVDVTFRQMGEALSNDAEHAKIGQRAVSKLLGEDTLAPMEKTMGAEDFAFYLSEKPGCFAFFGIATPELGAVHSHHSNNFTIDESALPKAAGVYAQYAAEFLNGNE